MYKIFILDDEWKHLLLIRDYLRFKGFHVFISTSPFKALELVKKLNPDLLVLDVMMPYIDGYNFVRKLKSSYGLSKIPFVFISAKGMSKDRVKAYKMGCSGYISKPFDPDELASLIHNILDKEKKREKEIVYTIKQIQKVRFYLQQRYYIFNLNSSKLSLTPQENRILNYLIDGLKNKEIAFKLDTSLRNIEKYITRLLFKTNTKNRAGLIRYVYLNNFNAPPEG